MKMIYFIAILVLAAIACGMNAAILPETNATATPFPTVTESPSPQYRVIAHSLNVREYPSLSAPVLYNLYIGAEVEAHGHRTAEGIRWVDIGDGWVAEAWLAPNQ